MLRCGAGTCYCAGRAGVSNEPDPGGVRCAVRRMNLPASALVVATQRIGDVLLATPLIRTLKRAWPHARIDALVFESTKNILAANPDLHEVITIPERPT